MQNLSRILTSSAISIAALIVLLIFFLELAAQQIYASTSFNEQLVPVQSVKASEKITIYQLKESESDAADLRFLYPEEQNSNFTICHLSDTHGMLEKPIFNSNIDSDLYCEESSFLPSNLNCIKRILTDANCDAIFFTGDLARHGDYPDQSELVLELLKFWNVNYWVPGNHEFDSVQSILVGDILDDESYSAKMVLSNIEINIDAVRIESQNGSMIPEFDIEFATSFEKNRYKYVSDKLVLKNGSTVNLCVYGVLDVENIGPSPSSYTFKYYDYFEKLVESIQDSSKEHCLDSTSIRIILTHIGNVLDEELAVKLAKKFPSVTFPIILGGHQHVYYPNYLLNIGNTHISHTGSSLGAVGKVILQRFNDTWTINIGKSELISAELTLERIKHPFYGIATEYNEFPHVQYLTSDMLSEICTLDKQLLTQARNLTIAYLTRQYKQKLFNWDRRQEATRKCRRGTCFISQWISNTILAYVTSKPCDMIECMNSKIGDWIINEPQNYADEFGYFIDNKPFNFIVAAHHSASLTPVFPTNVVTSLKIEAQKLAFDKDTHRSINRNDFDITVADIYGLFHYINMIRAAPLESLDNLCSIIAETIERYKFSFESLLLMHPAGFKYFVDFSNNLIWNDEKLQFSNKKFLNKQLWKLSSDQKIGLTIDTVDKRTIKGFCDKENIFHSLGKAIPSSAQRILFLGDSYMISLPAIQNMTNGVSCWANNLNGDTTVDALISHGAFTFTELKNNISELY